jgi:hypothetical protein
MPTPDMTVDVLDATPSDMRVLDVQVLISDATVLDMHAQMDATAQDIASQDVVLVDSDSDADTSVREAVYDASLQPVSRHAPACTHAPDVKPMWLFMFGLLVLGGSRRFSVIQRRIKLNR